MNNLDLSNSLPRIISSAKDEIVQARQDLIEEHDDLSSQRNRIVEQAAELRSMEIELQERAKQLDELTNKLGAMSATQTATAELLQKREAHLSQEEKDLATRRTNFEAEVQRTQLTPDQKESILSGLDSIAKNALELKNLL